MTKKQCLQMPLTHIIYDEEMLCFPDNHHIVRVTHPVRLVLVTRKVFGQT